MSTARARLDAMLDGSRPPGVYRWVSRAHPAAMRRELAAVDWGCHVIEGRTVTDRERFFDACSRSLALPAWFGRNFDALADCLSDLTWLAEWGYVVLWRHHGVLAVHDAECWTMARDVFADAARARREAGAAPLFLLLSGNGPTEGLATL